MRLACSGFVEIERKYPSEDENIEKIIRERCIRAFSDRIWGYKIPEREQGEPIGKIINRLVKCTVAAFKYKFGKRDDLPEELLKDAL